jgi:hypothetical protein
LFKFGKICALGAARLAAVGDWGAVRTSAAEFLQSAQYSPQVVGEFLTIDPDRDVWWLQVVEVSGLAEALGTQPIPTEIADGVDEWAPEWSELRESCKSLMTERIWKDDLQHWRQRPSLQLPSVEDVTGERRGLSYDRRLYAQR